MMPSPHCIRVYVAGPLFTQAEWLWNERLAKELANQSLDVILPQRRAEPMLTGKEPFNASVLFQANVNALNSAEAVVAILDGPDADSGTAWECGYAYKSGIPIIGIRTDIRAGGDDAETGVNLMLSMCSEPLVVLPMASRSDLSWIAGKLAKAVRQAAAKRVRDVK
jgi:nucleoside 2-deoxyribosyltransferase